MYGGKGSPGTGLRPKRIRLAHFHVGLAVARFHQGITERLLEGAIRACEEAGIDDDRRTVVWVPGAFELPLAAQELLRRGCDGVVCLGAVIRGETAHFDYVCLQASSGIMRVSLDFHAPVGFGVLTTDTAEQAEARAGGDKGNLGAEAARAMLEMADLLQKKTEETPPDRET